jgi:hypothetical protein
MDRCSTCGRSSGEMETFIERGASDHTGIGVSNVARAAAFYHDNRALRRGIRYCRKLV